MSWYFYINLIAYALIAIIGILICINKFVFDNYVSNDDICSFWSISCFIFFILTFVCGICRCDEVGRDSGSTVLDNSDPKNSMVFVVGARTLFLDGTYEYVLKPREKKQITWFCGSMNILDAKIVENKANSEKTSVKEEDIAKRYSELVGKSKN